MCTYLQVRPVYTDRQTDGRQAGSTASPMHTVQCVRGGQTTSLVTWVVIPFRQARNRRRAQFPNAAPRHSLKPMHS